MKPWPCAYAVDWDGIRLIELRWINGEVPNLKTRYPHALEGSFGPVSYGAKLVIFTDGQKPKRLKNCLAECGYHNIEIRPLSKETTNGL